MEIIGIKFWFVCVCVCVCVFLCVCVCLFSFLYPSLILHYTVISLEPYLPTLYTWSYHSFCYLYLFIMLPSLNSYYSLQDRPIIKRWAVGAQEARKPRRWWARAPKNHLAWIRIQASFILKGEAIMYNLSL